MSGRARAECRRGAAVAFALIAPIMLASCAADLNGGPYVDDSRNWPQPTYFTVVVRPGDTVSALAARYEVAGSAVARLNALDLRSDIHPGQVLRIPARSFGTAEAVAREATDTNSRNYAQPPKPIDVARYEPPSAAHVRVRDLPPPKGKPLLAPQPEPEPQVAAREAEPVEADDGSAQFVWPVHGRVILPFGSTGNGERNDGINIAASLGAPIHAAAPGTVTYAGNELKGYGNLVLIKHDDGYITAYAHAQSISVGRGDHVDKGQVIGYAGATGDVDSPQLHFEIRKGAQPINPRLLLAAR